jgi:hypothetical protein
MLAAVLGFLSPCRITERLREEMPWNVEGREPRATRRCEVVDYFDDDLDRLIIGIHFAASLFVREIYFVSMRIAAHEGVGHVRSSPWLQDGLTQRRFHSSQ